MEEQNSQQGYFLVFFYFVYTSDSNHKKNNPNDKSESTISYLKCIYIFPDDFKWTAWGRAVK